MKLTIQSIHIWYIKKVLDSFAKELLIYGLTLKRGSGK